MSRPPALEQCLAHAQVKTWPTVQSSGARIPQEATTCTVVVSYWYGYDTSFAA
jgi:hypothetical protein